MKIQKLSGKIVVIKKIEFMTHLLHCILLVTVIGTYILFFFRYYYYSEYNQILH